MALFVTAGPDHERELRDRLAAAGVDVTVFSPNLARRAALEHDLEHALEERCNLFLTELKAAAIEVVAERARRQGAEVAFLRNRPRSLEGEPDIDSELLRLSEEARRGAVAPAARP